MKREELKYEPNEFDPQPKKTQISRTASSTNKNFKIIPIKDSYLAKLLSKKPEKILSNFHELAENLAVKYRINADNYSTNLELSVENAENPYIDVVQEQFLNLLSEIQKSIVETKISCSLEEYNSLIKCIEKGKISIEGDLKYINELNSKPLVLKEFILNDSFSIEIVLVEDLYGLSFEPSDNLVINFSKNGVFFDDFMQKQRIAKKIGRFFKKNQGFYFKDEVFEANLPEFKVFIQLFDSKEILDENLQQKITRKYIRQILEKIQINKQYIDLYYPIPLGQEKPTIRSFIEEMLEISKTYPEDTNFLIFPSKISFLCLEKQKDILLEMFDKFKQIGSLEDLPADLKHAGKWYFNNGIAMGNPMGGYNNGIFANLLVNVNNPQNKGNSIGAKASKILEKAFIFGEKQGFVLLDQQKVMDGISNYYNNGMYPNLLKRIKNQKGYHSKSKNEVQDSNYMNEDEITIDLKKMIEKSKLTGEEKFVMFDDKKKEYQYLDAISANFLPYDPKINKALSFINKIHSKKLVYHMDFETMKPTEILFSFDLQAFNIKAEEGSVFKNYINNIKPHNNQLHNRNSLFAPQQPIQPGTFVQGQIFKIARRKAEELDPFLEKNLKQLKNNGTHIKLTEASGLEIEIINQKTPQLTIRSMEDNDKIVKNIREIFMKKQIIHHMRMKQNSKLLQKSLEDLCLRNNIEWDLNANVLKIKGNRKTINKIRTEIQKLDEMDMEDAIFPENWDPQTENLKEVDLGLQSAEFLTVSTAFNKTVNNANVLKVMRIQNKKLWENYVFEKKRLKFKGDCTEKMLFHGTRNNDPKNIYSGIEEGFDVRLANHGAVGKGIYFAEMASYSANGFQHALPNGNCLLIYANVLVGSFCDAMGGNYIMPPLMPNDSNMRYDSVRSGTNYVVYNSNRAYPAYILEYRFNHNNNHLGGRNMGLFNPIPPNNLGGFNHIILPPLPNAPNNNFNVANNYDDDEEDDDYDSGEDGN